MDSCINMAVEAGDYLPEELQWALNISLTAQDKKNLSRKGCGIDLIGMVIRGDRRVTEKTAPVVEQMISLARKRSLEMSGNGQKVFNIVDNYELSDNVELLNMCRDGRY